MKCRRRRLHFAFTIQSGLSVCKEMAIAKIISISTIYWSWKTIHMALSFIAMHISNIMLCFMIGIYDIGYLISKQLLYQHSVRWQPFKGSYITVIIRNAGCILWIFKNNTVINVLTSPLASEFVVDHIFQNCYIWKHFTKEPI